ncbi:Protein tssc1, partial [Quaeritorhiza haematococci]
SSDCQVNLQSVVSVSSAPFADDESQSETEEQRREFSRGDDEYGSNKPTDGLVLTYDQHEDSVYSVAWSNADPWIFASLSFDGRVVVNMVPRSHKYKIIL